MRNEETTAEGATPAATGGQGGESDAAPDFEDALSELEEIVRSLESEELELDEALSLFERGVERLRVASRLLDDAEGRVEELIEEASGALAVAELDLEAGDDGEDGG